MKDEPRDPLSPSGKPEPACNAAPVSAPADESAESPSPNQLTPEEQMALFEKELKENDWGHQPC